MSLKTRNGVSCPIFGAPKELNEVTLPTFDDVIRGFLFTRNYLEGMSVNRNRLVVEAADIIAKKVESIWEKAGIPVVSHQRIVEIIKKYQLKRQILLKPYKERKHIATYKIKLDAFKTEGQRLFDVAACKCTNFGTCACQKLYKVKHFFLYIK